MPFFADDETAVGSSWTNDWLHQLYEAMQGISFFALWLPPILTSAAIPPPVHETADWPLLQTIHTPWHYADIQQLLMQHDGNLTLDWFEDLTEDKISALIRGDNTAIISELPNEGDSVVVQVAKEIPRPIDIAEATLYPGMAPHPPYFRVSNC